MPDIAAKKIQKLAKIFLFRKKIFRLIHIQEVLYEQKVQRVYNILVPAMLRFHANVKVELTKQETKKLIKLRDIREKLAIIKIRKFFKRRK